MREMRQVVEMRASLGVRPARALELAEQGQREFGTGLFREEREAYAVFALDRLGRRAAASRRGTAFLAQHPRSAFAARVREIVGP